MFYIFNAAVYNISGDPIDNRLLKLNDVSRLAFRLNSENIERLLHLANVKCSQYGLCWKESPTSAIVNIREKEGDPI